MTGSAAASRRVPELLPRLVALLRLFVLPSVALTEMLTHQSHRSAETFELVSLAAGLYASVGLLVCWRPRPLSRRTWIAWISADLIVAAALVYFSDGAASDSRYVLIFVPVLIAVLGPLSDALLALLGACLVYALASVLHPVHHTSMLVAHLAEFAWVAAVMVTIGWAVGRGRFDMNALSEQRNALAAHANDTEARERRRLASEVHDNSLQSLLVVELELGRLPPDGPFDLIPATRAIQHAVASLRGTVTGLYQSPLGRDSLDDAIAAVARDRADLGGFEVTVSVDTDIPGPYAETLLTIAQELITNVAKHAEATRASIELRSDGLDTVLEVRDDGTGFDPEAATSAADGHIGLQAVADRAAAFGGAYEIASEAGTGTHVTVRLPAPIPAQPGGRVWS